jgi:hypothetical protein
VVSLKIKNLVTVNEGKHIPDFIPITGQLYNTWKDDEK